MDCALLGIGIVILVLWVRVVLHWLVVVVFGIGSACCASLAIGIVICYREQGLCPPGYWYRCGIGSTDGALFVNLWGARAAASHLRTSPV